MSGRLHPGALAFRARLRVQNIPFSSGVLNGSSGVPSTATLKAVMGARGLRLRSFTSKDPAETPATARSGVTI